MFFKQIIVLLVFFLTQPLYGGITGYQIEPYKWKFDGCDKGYKITLDYQWVEGEYHIIKIRDDQDLNWTILKTEAATWMPHNSPIVREDRPQLGALIHHNYTIITAFDNPKSGLFLKDIKPKGKIYLHLYPLVKLPHKIEHIEDIFDITLIDKNKTPKQIRQIKNKCKNVNAFKISGDFQEVTDKNKLGVKISGLLSFQTQLLPLEYTEKLQNSGIVYIHLNKVIGRYYAIHNAIVWNGYINGRRSDTDDVQLEDDLTVRIKTIINLQDKNIVEIILKPRDNFHEISPWINKYQLKGLINDLPKHSIFVRLKLLDKLGQRDE